MKRTICPLFSCYISVFVFLLCPIFCHSQLRLDIARARHELPGVENNFQRIDLLNRLSRLYLWRSLDSSIYYMLDAKALSEKIGYKKGLATAYANYAPYYAERGNLYLAYKFANTALDMFRSLGDREGEFDVLISIHTLCTHENKMEEAAAYLEKAQEVIKSVQNDSLLTIDYIVSANIYARNRPWVEIANLLDRARLLAEKRKDSLSIFQTDIGRGLLGFQYYGQEKDKSLQLVKPAVTGLEKMGAVFLSGVGNMNIGNVYQKAGMADSADVYYQKGLRYAESGNYLNLYMVTTLAALHNATGKRGMEKEVMQYNILAQKTDKMLAAENQNDGFSLLQATLREKDLQISEINGQAKRLWIFFLSAMSLSMLLFLFFLYRSYKQKRRYSAQQHVLIEELELKNKVLQENNEFNKSLISIMAHDLRQPFSSIIMLDRTTAKDSMQKEHYLAMIRQMRITSEKSIQIMDGLLQWMKLQLLGIGYQPSPINLLANIQEAISFNADVIARKKITVLNQIDDDILVNAQQEMLLFINRNIINNAVKFTPQNGEIRIKARQMMYEIRVSICDSGKGIPLSELANIFQNPKRGSAGTPTVKGAGIALFICKDMIAKMNGRIWAENDPEGKGAIFSYSLSIPMGQVSVNPLMEINGPGSLN